jgi:hypothetical protein
MIYPLTSGHATYKGDNHARKQRDIAPACRRAVQMMARYIACAAPNS